MIIIIIANIKRLIESTRNILHFSERHLLFPYIFCFPHPDIKPFTPWLLCWTATFTAIKIHQDHCL